MREVSEVYGLVVNLIAASQAHQRCGCEGPECNVSLWNLRQAAKRLAGLAPGNEPEELYAMIEKELP